jgi:hypothetical protein
MHNQKFCNGACIRARIAHVFDTDIIANNNYNEGFIIIEDSSEGDSVVAITN